MRLTDKIIAVIGDMDIPVIHGTAEQLGVLVDTIGGRCAALLDYGSGSEVVHGCARVERAAINVFFLERSSPSLSPDEVTALHERCKMMADDFVDRIGGNGNPEYSTLRIDGTVTYERVNLRYKGMYGGVMVSAQVTDLQGFAAPSSQFS